MAATAPNSPRLLFEDSLCHGLGPTWNTRPVGPLPTGDGAIAFGPDGLLVVPTGRDERTGAPAFLDRPDLHQDLRWAAFATPTTFTSPRSTGVGGPPTPVRAEVTVGVEPADPDHPPGTGLLTCAGLVAVDFSSGLVFDLLLTPTSIFALYERLSRPGDDHSHFCYRVPVAARRPGDRHAVAVHVDPGRGTVHWLVEGTEVLRVDRPGLRALGPAHLTSSGPGADHEVALSTTSFGLGLFTGAGRTAGIIFSARHFRLSSHRDA